MAILSSYSYCAHALLTRQRCGCFIIIVYNVTRKCRCLFQTPALETYRGSIQYLIGVNVKHLQHKMASHYSKTMCHWCSAIYEGIPTVVCTLTMILAWWQLWQSYTGKRSLGASWYGRYQVCKDIFKPFVSAKATVHLKFSFSNHFIQLTHQKSNCNWF